MEQAKRMIESLVSGDTNNQPNLQQALRVGQGPKSMGEVIVPRSSVGIIIGKGGDTIKRMAQETGAKIQFKPDGRRFVISNFVRNIHAHPKNSIFFENRQWSVINALKRDSLLIIFLDSH